MESTVVLLKIIIMARWNTCAGDRSWKNLEKHFK